jgi:hypothetical protein
LTATAVGSSKCDVDVAFTRAISRCAEQRKKLAQRIKELTPAASNRQIAKTLGTSKDSINRDVGADAPPEVKPLTISTPRKSRPANAPPVLSGAAAAQTVHKHETKEERRQEEVETRKHQFQVRLLPSGLAACAVADHRLPVLCFSPKGP